MNVSTIISIGPSPAAQLFQDAFRRRDCLSVCTIATTDTVLIPGISAAGATPELRRYTAAADVEFLCRGRVLCMDDVPRNPDGPPSPVVISAAATGLMAIPTLVIDAGSAVRPAVPCIRLRDDGLRCITTGRAFDDAMRVWDEAAVLGAELARIGRAVVLGESVPGGTTTALSLMTALGIKASGRVSSSMPGNVHTLKEDIVLRAHEAAGLSVKSAVAAPVEAAGMIGDSMQVVNASLCAALSRDVPVVLAGGTQMLAVVALMVAAENAGSCAVRWENVAVGTTRWVLDDPSADFRGLLDAIRPGLATFAAGLDFSQCADRGLRRYEEGLVKEGVGAGGLAVAALLKGVGYDDLLAMIEKIAASL